MSLDPQPGQLIRLTEYAARCAACDSWQKVGHHEEGCENYAEAIAYLREIGWKKRASGWTCPEHKEAQ